jgi:hypothetical protein
MTGVTELTVADIYDYISKVIKPSFIHRICGQVLLITVVTMFSRGIVFRDCYLRSIHFPLSSMKREHLH